VCVYVCACVCVCVCVWGGGVFFLFSLQYEQYESRISPMKAY